MVTNQCNKIIIEKMKIFKTLIIAIIISYSTYSQSKQEKNLTFLHTSGQDMVNESGEKVFLKGVGLGNWLLPEGYMWKFGGLGDRPRKIEKVVEDLIGKEKSVHFWNTFRQNYITEADIKRIAELGFNSAHRARSVWVYLDRAEVFVENNPDKTKLFLRMLSLQGI